MARRRKRRVPPPGHSSRRSTRQSLTIAAEAAGVIGALVAAAALIWSFLASEEQPPRREASRAEEAVHVRTIYEDIDQPVWIVPRSAVPIPAEPPCDVPRMRARTRWFRQNGAAPVDENSVRISATNDSDATVVVEALRLDYLKRLPPIQGFVAPICSGGGAIEEQTIELDLDQSPPTFRFLQTGTGPPIGRFAFAPTKGRPIVFWVIAHSQRDRYRWSAVLTYSLNGRSHDARIDNRGRPFDLSPCTDSRRRYGMSVCPPTDRWRELGGKRHEAQ